MSEARIDSLSNESNTGGPTLSGITTFSGTNYFVPPVGNTAQRPQDPQKGEIRFNTDTAHLEYYRGDTIGWSEVEAIEAAPIGGRAVINLGDNGGGQTIDYITISTTGNALDFGDTPKKYYEATGLSNNTRGVFCGGTYGGEDGVMEFIEFATLGNAVDFGDQAENNNCMGGVGDHVRGIMTGGASPASNIIQYITIPSKGNATDFGADQPFSGAYCGGINDSTRGVQFGGRVSPFTAQNAMWYMTIQTTGIVNDFGDLQIASHHVAGASSSTRGVFGGGVSPSGTTISYNTIQTTGNAIDFGDFAHNRQMTGGTSNATRGVFVHGSSPLANYISYVTIATLGDAIDFGDTTGDTNSGIVMSNSHGGLSG